MSDLIQRSYDLMGYFVRAKRYLNQERLRPSGAGTSGSYPEFTALLKRFGELMHTHKELVEKMHSSDSVELREQAVKSLSVLLNLQRRLKQMRNEI